MLSALKEDKNKIFAWEVLDRQIKFFCPDCNNEMLYVDAKLKIKHFRHKIKADCGWEPETQRHLEMKQYAMNFFELNKDNLEYGLGFARPDLYIPDKKIAIEVQHSKLSVDKFIERTNNYTQNGINVLWIFDESLLGESVSAMLKKAHELYFGRIYVYNVNKIVPVHFLPKQRYVEEWEDFGGYYKTYKNKKILLLGEQIQNNSLLLITNNWKDKNYLIARFYDKRFWEVKDVSSIQD